MDLRDFQKEVTRIAREAVPVAQAIAPTYKTAAVVAAGVYAPYAVPFLAVLPPDVVLAAGLAPFTGGASFLLLAPELRPDRHGVKVDYAKLGEAAAMTALKGA